jgi:[acyl-carrier-protein] S-malonyltransferase
MKESILVVAPGRGSYSKATMGILQNRSSKRLEYIGQHRLARNRISPIEIDALPRFQSRKHLAGEEASLLTASCSIADFDDIDQDRFDVVGICGNSMGHYTALILSGALSLDDGITLIDTMGDYQKDNIIGAQQVYFICDAEWNIIPE